jgi:hypothetical protein
MLILRTSRKPINTSASIEAYNLTSNFFPPIVGESAAETKSATEQSTEPSELASQLPDAPTTEPKDIEDNQEPLSKKQKTTEADDDFVVVEREDTKDDKVKPEL